MAKVFTITEGLENLGALKSGGQGSVYKARKTGEIITAIKILPTPIYSETEDDKHFISFQNEVQKLKKVNEVPNPNVVSIIASGITSSGNLPFIEMEYIEGADLGELLKPPYNPVFTIKETIKVADHLANALAHCHQANIKHGDIKSNNVKFNQRTGNYILLDFGLSVMSDEQRRTSIRYAGAIEFMAPEQSGGETLFETDIYSFGIILFELLAGTVPFPLTNKGEMARNAVMLAHLETMPPDIISLRRESLPDSWDNDKREREMQVPVWLLSMIYKCLEKDPAKRFKDGAELQEFIHFGSVREERKKVASLPAVEPAMLRIDESVWRKEIHKLQTQLAEKDELLTELQIQIGNRDKALYDAGYPNHSASSTKRVLSKMLVFVVLAAALGFAGFAGYKVFFDPRENIKPQAIVPDNPILPEKIDSVSMPVNKPVKKITLKPANNPTPIPDKESVEPHDQPAVEPESGSDTKNRSRVNEYEIINTAYFYNKPDVGSKSNVFLTAGSVELTTLDETSDFIYVTLTGSNGKTTKGWLSRKDFILANEY